MALPSSRRPKELEEEFEREVQQQKRQQLVWRVNKADVFNSRLDDWFQHLGRMRQKAVTPKELKRQAIRICSEHKLMYSDLPLDWVDNFKKRFDVKLRETKKRKKKTDSSSSSVRASKRARLNRTSATASDPNGQLESSSSAEEKTSSSVKVPKEHCKKFLDLSEEVPPPSWLTAFADGIILPRVLTTYSTEDVNILYYDYAPKLKDQSGNEVKLGVQPRLTHDGVGFPFDCYN